ncbi:hypothetical protein, partial [Mycetocola reblochoni]|uniref:hypothetical protein n=1 Tax=Mycetocola reblochoni TaxID=331618 RepID=UPI003F97DFA9
KIYDAHWTLRQERRPMPDGFLEYEETVRSDLDAWVRGKTKPKDLFTSIDFNQARSAAVARSDRGGRRAGGLRHRLRAFGRRYVP